MKNALNDYNYDFDTEIDFKNHNIVLFDTDSKDNIYKFALCAISVLIAFFGIWGGFRGGFTITSLILFVSMTLYLFNNKIKINPFSLSCGILSCLVSLCFIITSNGTVKLLSVIFMILLSSIWFSSLARPQNDGRDYNFICSFVSPIKIGLTTNLPRAFMSFFVSNKENNKKFGKIMLGIAFSIPVLLVVVPLLTKSDAAFSGFIGNIFGRFWINFFKILVGLIIGLFLVSYCFTLKKEREPKFSKPDFLKVDSTIVISFLSVLGICYLMYLFSQLAYFFSAFSGILPDDFEFTFAEYARRGFFEMCTIAVINFVIIYATLLFSQKKSGKLSVPSKCLCIFIGIFTLVIISTAISKMIMYINNYGMTELRITTSAFMIFLAIIFISVMIKVFVAKIRIIKIMVVAAACVLCVLGTVNVNGFIAEYNYTAYKDKNLTDIDVDAIYELGDEGVPYLVKLASDKNEDVRVSAKGYLKTIVKNQIYFEIEQIKETNRYRIIKKSFNEIGQYNIALSRAYASLEEYIKKNPSVLKVESNNSYDKYSYINEYYY